MHHIISSRVNIWKIYLAIFPLILRKQFYTKWNDHHFPRQPVNTIKRWEIYNCILICQRRNLSTRCFSTCKLFLHQLFLDSMVQANPKICLLFPFNPFISVASLDMLEIFLTVSNAFDKIPLVCIVWNWWSHMKWKYKPWYKVIISAI